MSETYQLGDPATNGDLDGSDFTGHDYCNENAGAVWNGQFEGAQGMWMATSGTVGGKDKGGNCYIAQTQDGYALVIMCCNNDTCAIVVWAGAKSGGSNPTGLYFRTSGSDPRDRISVKSV